MYKNLFTQWVPDATIITGSRRLANTLHAEYINQQQIQQLKVWPTPDILTIEDWFIRCWHDFTITNPQSSFILLTLAQEQTLWEQIIYDSSYGDTLLRVSATAKLAREAWQLMKQWQLDIHSEFFKQSNDSAIWHTWATEFKKRCLQNNWLDIVSIPEQLNLAITTRLFALPKKIFLIGFDELNPQYTSLFKLMTEQGCECILFDQNIKHQTNTRNHSSEAYQLPLTSRQDELYTMAHWAKHLWQQGSIRIGCIVPNLHELRQELIDTFTEVLIPTAMLPENSYTSLPFNIAGGMSFNQFPLIKIAFAVLNLDEEVNLTLFSHVLRTAYLTGGTTEIALRARVDIALKEFGEPEIHWRQILLMCKKLNCIQLNKQLSDYFDSRKKYHHQIILPSQWANVLNEMLLMIGWPGDRHLDSGEYQIVERWTKLLEEFAKQDILLGAISYQTAVQKLEQLAASTLFQPQTGFKPIQILDVSETAGLAFRHVWIMGLNDSQWPPAIHPNSFIPLRLQQQFNMPHSSNARQLQFYRTLTQRLLNSANCCVITSYAQQEEGRALRPSALIKNLPIINKEKLALAKEINYVKHIQQSAEIECVIDQQGPALIPEEKISGGTEIFKHQAACPFRSFARFRLQAKPITQLQLGLNANQRGILLHRSLEALYNLIETQEKLLSLTTIALTQIIEQAINIACNEFSKKYSLTFKKNFSYIEKNRLKNLLERWLDFEKQRPAFAIASVEQTVNFNCDTIPLKLRVDRIDKLTDGNLIIIDYKTGNISSNNLFGDRLDEPQLPIYCISHEAPIKAVIFVQLRSQGYKIDGISAYETSIPGVKTIKSLKDENIPKTWDELLVYWRTHLFNLSQQFQQGNAKIDPKNGRKSCTFCDFKTLCRYSEIE